MIDGLNAVRYLTAQRSRDRSPAHSLEVVCARLGKPVEAQDWI